MRRAPSGQHKLVIIPQGKDIPRGTLLTILEQAGLNRNEFLRLLRD
jgi:predicted RNA binding protein YcfA (HicA-like mRNA interferase family)